MRTYFGDHIVKGITGGNSIIEYSEKKAGRSQLKIRGKNQDTAELAILEYAVTVRLGNKV